MHVRVCVSRGSSEGIVSGYGLGDQAIEIRSPAEAHPASCTVGTGGVFPGAKARPGRDFDHSPPI
jgi:hypothetical protein